MNTTIIIVLGALILIVVVAIIVILIKSKDPEEVDSSESNASGKTFQEETLKPPKESVQVSELESPKLHEKEVVSPSATVSKSPVMNNLATPQETPAAQSTTVPIRKEKPTVQEAMSQSTPNSPQTTVTQDKDMYKSNPLPGDSKMSSDMENLQKSMQRPIPQEINKPPIPMEAPTEPQATQKDELDSITNDINNVLQSEDVVQTNNNPVINQASPVIKPTNEMKVGDDLENRMPQPEKPEDITSVPPIPPIQPGQALPDSTQFNAPQSQAQENNSTVPPIPPIPPIQPGQALPDSPQPNTQNTDI